MHGFGDLITLPHEVGHALRLAYKKQELPDFEGQDEEKSHDLGPWPEEMAFASHGLMFPNRSKPKNHWIRKDDWRVSNIQADRLK
jgi:hypothetical protein